MVISNELELNPKLPILIHPHQLSSQNKGSHIVFFKKKFEANIIVL